MTTERGTDTRDVVEGQSKEEETGGDGDKLKLEENEEQQTGKGPDDGSVAAAGSAVPSKAPSKASVRSSSAAAKDTSAEAGAAEVGSPKEDAKGSQSSVRSISIYARASSTASLHFLEILTYRVGRKNGSYVA